MFPTTSVIFSMLSLAIKSETKYYARIKTMKIYENNDFD
jgi:hypothetical protein